MTISAVAHHWQFHKLGFAFCAADLCEAEATNGHPAPYLHLES